MRKLTIRVYPTDDQNYRAIVVEWPETHDDEEEFSGRTPNEALGQCIFWLSCSAPDPLENCTLDVLLMEEPWKP